MFDEMKGGCRRGRGRHGHRGGHHYHQHHHQDPHESWRNVANEWIDYAKSVINQTTGNEETKEGEATTGTEG